MRYFFVILLFISTSIQLNAKAPEVSRKFEKEVEKHFDSESVQITINEDLSTDREKYFDVISEGAERGIVVLTSAKGRYEMFDYMVIYNMNIEIELIKVLVYRSQYGSEIMSKRWLSQFYEKQNNSLKYGSDIQAISGATFSASSLTKNINRINNILKQYRAD